VPTIFHVTPTVFAEYLQALQDRYGGWTNSTIVDDFTNYSVIVFKAFGERVKNWITLNEPRSFCWLGYGIGIHAPGIKVQNPRNPPDWRGSHLR
jgi:beta-glucosidase/6-phospho-beta-glucosidase/beta-galactosidase